MSYKKGLSVLGGAFLTCMGGYAAYKNTIFYGTQTQPNSLNS